MSAPPPTHLILLITCPLGPLILVELGVNVGTEALLGPWCKQVHGCLNCVLMSPLCPSGPQSPAHQTLQTAGAEEERRHTHCAPVPKFF